MPLSSEEREDCLTELTEFMKDRRPPPHLRDQLDIRYSIDGQSVVLFEVRPAWDGRGDIIERPFAKMTLVRKRKMWKLYWMRASGKWHLYEPAEYPDLEDALAAVHFDDRACFFG